jgi:UDP-N-acetylglucosamine 2-epimerase (non-hydrolysing)
MWKPACAPRINGVHFQEINRIVTDAVSDLCFTSANRARRALLREGIADNIIRVTGNTVIDAAVAQRNGFLNNPLSQRNQTTILVTAHRRESLRASLHL